MRKSTSPSFKFRKGEKLILALIMFVAILTPVCIVYSNAELSSSNIEVEKLKKQIVFKHFWKNGNTKKKSKENSIFMFHFFLTFKIHFIK